MSRFILPQEFRAISGNVKITDDGLISFEGLDWAFDVRGALGGSRLDIKGIHVISESDPADPSIPGTVIRVARTHQEVPYKIISLLFMNAEPALLTLGVETNLSHRRTITLPSLVGREIFVDFAQDEEPLTREDAIEFRPVLVDVPLPTRGVIRIVVGEA